jgi:antitoxin (DNA-binding transcriptional repressor) of toxin-antitoxin stability system
MSYNVHMRSISIRELHINTGRWVRHAARHGAVVVTDRGRVVARLQPHTAADVGRPLPDREASIRARSRLRTDSADAVAADRERA